MTFEIYGSGVSGQLTGGEDLIFLIDSCRKDSAAIGRQLFQLIVRLHVVES